LIYFDLFKTLRSSNIPNRVIGKLTVKSDNTDESKESLQAFEAKGCNVKVFKSEKDRYEYVSESDSEYVPGCEPEYEDISKTLEVAGSEYPYIVESLNMDNFIPRPLWMKQYENGISSDDENYKSYMKWFEENFGGPDHMYRCSIVDKKTSSAEFEGNSISYYCFVRGDRPITKFIENVSIMYPKLTFQYEFHDDHDSLWGDVIVNKGSLLWNKHKKVKDYRVSNTEELKKLEEDISSGKFKLSDASPEINDILNSNSNIVWKNEKKDFWDEIVFTCKYDFLTDSYNDCTYLGIDRQSDSQYRNTGIEIDIPF